MDVDTFLVAFVLLLMWGVVGVVAIIVILHDQNKKISTTPAKQDQDSITVQLADELTKLKLSEVEEQYFKTEIEGDKIFLTPVRITPIKGVSEVRYGKWQYIRSHYDADECVCSICEQSLTTWKGKRMPYCPHCGARMEAD